MSFHAFIITLYVINALLIALALFAAWAAYKGNGFVSDGPAITMILFLFFFGLLAGSYAAEDDPEKRCPVSDVIEWTGCYTYKDTDDTILFSFEQPTEARQE